MSLKLYGSIVSPYVRRIRMLLEGIDYEFILTNIYDDALRAKFSSISPIKKIPVLTDGDITVFDSHVIHHHIQQKYDLQKLSIEEHNVISVIDAITDSLLITLLSQRSEIPIDADKLLFKFQLERIPNCMDWLNHQAKNDKFEEWRFSTMAMLSLVDWIEFRDLYDFSPYPELLVARDRHSDRAIVVTTRPE